MAVRSSRHCTVLAFLLDGRGRQERLLDIHARTGFADEFTHITEGRTRAADLAVSISAVLVAEACTIGLEPLVQVGVIHRALLWKIYSYFGTGPSAHWEPQRESTFS